MPINGSAGQTKRDVVSLSDLIINADELADRAHKVASSFEVLSQDFAGDSFPNGPADASGTGSGGHIGALETRLGQIQSAIAKLEVCREELAARIGPTPNPNISSQDAGLRMRATAKYAGIDDPHLYPETR